MIPMLRALGVLGLTVAMAGCGFWGGTEEVQPTPLADFTPEKQVKVLWETDIGVGPGEAYHQFEPAVDGESLFAADREGKVVALDRKSGKQAWSVDLNLPLSGAVGAGHGAVVVASENGDVVALSADDGHEMWRAKVASEVVAPPQFNADLVVVQVINGMVTAFDRESGKQRWTFDSQIPQLSLRGTSAPLVFNDVTLAGFANGKLIAINNQSGAELWEQRIALAEGRSELERIVDVDGRPILYEGLMFVSSYHGRLVAINPYNAKIVWSTKYSSYRSLAAGFGNVYAMSADDEVNAFDAKSRASVWQQAGLLHRGLTSPAVLGNTVVVGDAEGYLHFLSQVDGHFVARYNFDSSGFYSAPLVVDDTLYVLSNDGHLAALKLN